MQYLVIGSNGPGFGGPDEELEILEHGIMPTFAAIETLQSDGRIVGGGLPVGERTFVLIVEAASHEELDNLLRDLPAWGALEWEVTPLQSFSGRAAKEKSVIARLKG